MLPKDDLFIAAAVEVVTITAACLVARAPRRRARHIGAGRRRAALRKLRTAFSLPG